MTAVPGLELTRVDDEAVCGPGSTSAVDTWNAGPYDAWTEWELDLV